MVLKITILSVIFDNFMIWYTADQKITGLAHNASSVFSCFQLVDALIKKLIKKA